MNTISQFPYFPFEAETDDLRFDDQPVDSLIYWSEMDDNPDLFSLSPRPPLQTERG